MFRWNRMLRSLFGLRREQPKGRHPLKTVRLNLEPLEERFLLSTYKVTSTGDDGSAGTLRYAINQANAPGSTITEIDFNIGTSGSTQTISLASQLPALTANGVFINSLSQGGSGKLITLNGTGAGSSSDGLLLQGSNDTVSGLIINNFNNGIEVAGAANTIGGTTAGAGNVLSGNRKDGLLIDSSGSGNHVLGNFIGVGVSGSNGVGNLANGIEILGLSNTIGGTAYGSRNILSGNSQDGVLIDSGASSNQVLSNFIGVNASGTADVANINGIEVKGTGNTLGGTVAGSYNIISGNSQDGVLIDSGASGNSVFGNNIGINVNGNAALANNNGIEVAGNNNALGTSYGVTSNVLSGNSNDGLLLDSTARGNQVLGNYIGTNNGGTAALPNKVGIEDAGSSNTLGGGVLGDRNVISGNSTDGVQLDSTATAETIQNNAIGLNANENAPLANGGNGVEVKGNNNLNGGNSLSNYFTRNFISGNGHDGVLIDPGATGNQVQGNFIGVAVSGTNGVGNAAHGIEIQGSGDTIGGTTSGVGNVVSGNGIDGILLASMTADNLVQGNDLGTDYTGKVAVANGGNGVEIASTGNTVGGTASGARNIISGNSQDGVLIDSTASGNQVQGNYIGINYSSGALGNGANGVEIDGRNNSIGGSVSGAGNTIAYNSYGGVLDTIGAGNTIRQNSIYANGPSNTGPGIQLSNGGNNSLGAPSIASDTVNGSTLMVQGTFNAPTANVSYVLEFFANPSGDPEGKIYLGSLTVTPTSTGTQKFTFTTTTTVMGTDPLITTTLTDPSGDTSEFPSTVSGKVWLDSNGDGIENNGETGMSGITVTLEAEDSAGDVINSTSTTTDVDGNYVLLLPSDTSGYQYQIYVPIPSGYVATNEDANSSGTVSYIDPGGNSPFFASGESVTINAGLDYSAAPFAADASYSVIHDQMFTVPAANGVLANDTDPNNLPLTAALVSGPSNGTLQFNSDGSFTYTPKAGYTGSDSFIYSASDGTYSSNATVSLTVDGTISGQVWLDSNEDGIEDNSETGMSGITVDLVTPDNVTVSSTTTDANGDYQLAVDPTTLNSTFEVQVVIPQGYWATIPFTDAGTSAIFSSIDYSGYFNVSTGPENGGLSNINAGLCMGTGPLVGSISGKVWLDSNDNGIMENGEPGLQGIAVTLYGVGDASTQITTTDANGDYSFICLAPTIPYEAYYEIQLYAPNGYVYSPQNVGPPATSSNVDPDLGMAVVTLSPGQNDTTVNAGLYGSAPIAYQRGESAPIAYQRGVSITAENDSYTGMDLTADGYDPNGEPLTPIITQAPSYGSLVYDTSTGLYDYTAPIGYTGEDSFEYELSNGHAVSNVVQVQILAYAGIIPPGSYDDFPALGAALYTPTTNVPQGNAPDPSSVEQGSLDDCWYLAAAAGLAQQNPNQIVSMIEYSKAANTYKVFFSGKPTTTISGNLADGHNYAASNGDWLRVLEKAYGQMMFNKYEMIDHFGVTPYRYIDQPDLPSTGVETLTGHSTDVDWFWSTRDSVTRQKLANAFANDKVVTAQIFGGSSNEAMAKQNGLVAYHIYTVVAYDATNNRVRLYNPHHSNPVYSNGTDSKYWRGKNDSDNPPPNTLPPGGNGYFWMTLPEFTEKFSAICYEE